jgi:flagellar biosynthesis/type III secretory pathway M-ring protein FliF/YscJ
MCQLFLIPSNKSIINKTEIKIDLNEGQYKIAIIGTVTDSEIPFEIMYNILELNVIKKTNTTLIILLILLGAMIFILILFMIFRKKILFALKRRRLSENIFGIDMNKNILKDNEEKEEKENLEKLMKIISNE